MSWAIGLIDSEPLLVASSGASFAREYSPGLAPVCRAPQVVAKKGLVNVRLKTEVEKLSNLVGICHRVAAEDVVLQNAGKRPGCAAVGGVGPAGLPEVGDNVVELSPGDRHLAQVRWVNGNGALVRGVSEDVIPVCIDVYLKARKRTELQDHSRRSLYFSRRRRRVVVFFQGLVSGYPRCGRQLSRSAGKRNE